MARCCLAKLTGVTVFEILYQDGCRYFGFTGTSVFKRLVELSNGLVDVRWDATGGGSGGGAVGGCVPSPGRERPVVRAVVKD